MDLPHPVEVVRLALPHPGDMTNSQRLLVALLGAGTLIVLPSAAHASPPTETKTITVNAPFTDPEPSQYDGFQCTGLPGTPSCGLHSVGTSTWSGGTFTADEHYALTGGPTTDGKFTYAGAAYLTGAIEGCGSGTFIIETDDGYVDFAKTDPNDNLPGGVGGSAPGFNHWQLRAGSGTGGLAGLVSGGGEVNWRYYHQGGAGLGGPEGIGVLTGTITCQVPRAPAPAPHTKTRAVADPRVATAAADGQPTVAAVNDPRAATAAAAVQPTVAVLAATSERAGTLPRTGGAAAAALAGAALLAAGLVTRRMSRA